MLNNDSQNSVPDGMVIIPEGTFLFGDDRETKELETFYIDIFPVTNSDYKKFLEETGYMMSEGSTAFYPHWFGGKVPEDIEDHPMINVSYFDAHAYAEWAGKDLPSEEQWEKASSGTEGFLYPWGTEFSIDRCNTAESGIHGTTPVNKYKDWKSPYGCIDIAGNVWEWTATWYEQNEKFKVLRGGSFFHAKEFASCKFRNYFSPKNRLDLIGFRCVKKA